jgi:hypothetical protein
MEDAAEGVQAFIGKELRNGRNADQVIYLQPLEIQVALLAAADPLGHSSHPA